MKKEKIIIIIGPTAVGKTALSIQLAEKFNGEIISGDSMQIYKDLDIGTAKVHTEEKGEIPHHLIDVKEIDEDYSVSDFQEEASKKIKEISDRNHLPIIVGGSGLYIESLLYPVSHAQVKPNEELRKSLTEFAKETSNQELWEKLNKVDSKAAQKIHPNNVRRVIRALEVYKETGNLFSSFQEEREKKESKYNPFIIGLNTDRKLLYDRINQRVDEMVKAGLFEEARALWEKLGPQSRAQSIKGIGYKELYGYFNNKIGKEEAIELVKKNSRRYAKRQLTWFRNRLTNVQWYDFVKNPETINDSYQEIGEFLEND